MSKAVPVSMKKGNLSEEEYARRENMENYLKGDSSICCDPPDNLSDFAKAVYTEIIETSNREVLNRTDQYTVEVIADAVANMRSCRLKLNREGLFSTYTNSAGKTNEDQNKAVLVYQKYAEIFKKYIPELGLSPSARSKIAAMANSAPDGNTKKKTLMDILNEDDED